MRRLAFLILCASFLAPAEDAQLANIRGRLLPMRSNQPLGQNARGAKPALTTVKHELIAWIESRLPAMRWNGSRWHPDPIVLQEQLNEELRQAGLFCDAQSGNACADPNNPLGFLGRVVLDMQRGSVLIVRTSVAVQVCGEDLSAYAYKTDAEGRWHRFWESEQNDYQEGKYFPQLFDQVLVSPADFQPKADRNEHLILTIGHEPWCTSNWHDVYYRVWQTTSADPAPKLLLNGTQWSYIADDIRGSVNRTDVLFEYSTESIEGGLPRPEIRHYELQSGALVRVDPVALSPRDFTAFWLTHPWEESSLWTVQESRIALEEWRRRNGGPFDEFAYPTRHCKQPDLWQVSTRESDGEKKRVYFLVRWRPPYRFMMVAAGAQASPDCTERDLEADRVRSLFPDQ